jgi:septal ring factor EnvC (AmiA/AmiB activator)
MNAVRSAAVLGLGLALAVGLAGPAVSRSSQQAAETEKRLAKIKEDIENLKAKISEEEKKEKTVLSALDRIGFRKSLLRNELALLEADLGRNRMELAAIKANIPRLQADLERERGALVKVLVTLYKYGRTDAVRTLLSAPGLRSLLQESKNLAVLAAAQNDVIAAYVKGLTELGREADKLKAKERDIQRLIQQSTAKRAAYDAEEKKDRALVAEITSNRKTYEQTLEELALRARELQQLLERFESGTSAVPFPLIPFTEKKGKLPWPSGGRVQQAFGLQHGPFNTATMNNGVEIAPPSADLTVRAVHGGKVVFAEYFQGYGKLLIIDHGLSYYSLYGHCADVLVRAGDFVMAGQPIAIAGDTGSMVGVSVYFEIRYKTKPLDPLQWLSRR